MSTNIFKYFLIQLYHKLYINRAMNNNMKNKKIFKKIIENIDLLRYLYM